MKHKTKNQYWIFINIKNQIRSRKVKQSRADKLVASVPKNELRDWWAWTPQFRDWIPLRYISRIKNGKTKLLIELEEPQITSDETIDKTFAAFNDDDSVGPSEGDKANPAYPKESKIKDEKKNDEKINLMNESVRYNDFDGEDLTLSDIPAPPTLGHFKHPFGSGGHSHKNENQKKTNLSTEERAENKNKNNNNSDDRRGAPRYDVQFDVLVLAQGKSFKTTTINISESGAFLKDSLPSDFANIPLEVVFMLTQGQTSEKFAVRGRILTSRDNLRYLTFNIGTAENKKGYDRLMMLYFQGR